MALLNLRLLRNSWEFDSTAQLGKGGAFGAVFAGRGEDGRAVAIKRLYADPTGVTSREISLARSLLGHTHPHVIGMLDVGVDASTNTVFLVMERAQQSLQKLLDESAPLGLAEALLIINAIATGLEEIGDLVHRDLKPDNVLLHNGVWKLADLGLARIVSAGTEPNTMRRFLTVQYCAPEQCRLERPTKAADVYALGGIIYALFTGQPPFRGPTQDDYLHQHQHEKPPKLRAPPTVRELALDCLAKAAAIRPSLRDIRTRVRHMLTALGVST